MTGRRAAHEIGWRGLLLALLLGVPMAFGIGVLAAAFNEGPTPGLGVLLTVISVFDLDIGSQLVLVVLLLAAGADVFARYNVLRRREV